jgi:hypothetical protein
LRQPEEDAPLTTAVIAPDEIQELIARLTERSVEGVPYHEARTLEGLAVETGIPVGRLQDELTRMRRPRIHVPPLAVAATLLMGGYAYWLLKPKGAPPAPAVAAPAPAAVTPDLSGLVPLSSVTYGPDSGPEMADPGFEPSKPMPEGLSVWATSGGVLWGAGDHRAAVIDKKLPPDVEAAVKDDIIELLKYARADAARRHLPLVKGRDRRDGFPVNLTDACYYGVGGTSASIPPPGKENDQAAERAINRAARELLDRLKERIRQQSEWNRDSGP